LRQVASFSFPNEKVIALKVLMAQFPQTKKVFGRFEKQLATGLIHDVSGVRRS
jgi:hypothetical protein